jgi:hypothetical protein
MNWRKSTYSSSEGGACVEIAAAPDTILIRDSKHTTGPLVSAGGAAWVAFVRRLAA